MISVKEYHRLKSYHPRKTTHEQLTRVPHICESKEWRTSPHCGKQCWHCVEVTKIIEFENFMEEKYQNRQHTLSPCYCHWCKNRLRLSHETCITCNPEVNEEDWFITLTDSDEEEFNNSSTPSINKGKRRLTNNNINKKDNIIFYDDNWSTNSSENNDASSTPWSLLSNNNKNYKQQPKKYTTEWFRNYWAKTEEQKSNIEKPTLPLRTEKYTIRPKQKDKQIENRTNNVNNQLLNKQTNQWNSCDTAKIVELNTTIWKLGMIIGPKYGSKRHENPQHFNIPQQYYNPQFLN